MRIGLSLGLSTVHGNAPAPSPLLVVSAATNVLGLAILLTMNRALDSGSVPDASVFTTHGTSSDPANPLLIVGSLLTIPLTIAVGLLDTITLDYTPSGTPIRTTDGAELEAFTGLEVENLLGL